MSDFEKKIKFLEGIVSDLEKGSFELEDMILKFESGVEAYQDCKKILEQSEQKIAKLNDQLVEVSIEG